MTGKAPSKKQLHKAAKILSAVVLAMLCILLLIAVSLRIYLASSHSAAQLSRIVTSQLHENFTVQSLQSSGGALVLKGVRLKNPDGFPQGDLAAADSVTIAPQWGDFLQRRQRFRLIALDGIKINLEKNGKGVWNYSQLQQVLAAGKPSPTESFIRELVIRNGSLRVQGEGVQGVNLQVFDLTTKGSLDSRVDLAFQDAAQNRYALKGKARGGTDAALDLTLTAPSLSLKDLAAMLKLKNTARFEGGKGNLQLNLTLHKGKLSTVGDLSFRGMQLPARVSYPVAGTLHLAADYDLQSDKAILQRSTLTVEKLVKLHAEGHASGLKREREFSLAVGMDDVDLSALNILVPDETRRNMLFGGRLRCDGLNLQGNIGKGLKSATGILQLRDGSVSKGGRLMLAGLSGTIGFSRQNAAILTKGKLSVSGPHDKALLEALELPFAVTLSSTLKPLRAEVPAFSAQVMEVPVRGRVSFDAAKAAPIAASLKAPAVKLAAFNEQLKRYDLQASAGTCVIALDLAGRNAQELSGTASVQISDFRGSRGKSALALKSASVAAKVQRRGGKLQAQGSAQLASLAMDGKTADARFGFRVADGVVRLDALHAAVAGTQVSISHLSAAIPASKPAGKATRLPATVDFDGGAIKQGDIEAVEVSGRLRGSYNSDSAGKWLEGTAELSSGGVSRHGTKLTAPIIRATFARSGGRAELSGQLLGGKTTGTASFNPFAPDAGGNFDLAVTGAELAAAAKLAPKQAGLNPSEGMVDLHLNGSYSKGAGLACRFDSKGSGIALTGAGGKRIISGAGVTVSGGLAGGNLSVSEAVLSAAPGVALHLKGELAQALSEKRQGTVHFSLPQTDMNGIIDPFANVLPKMLQEATVAGSIGADGKIAIAQGRQLLHGSLAVKGGRMEVPAQKLVLADINGSVPFSMDLSGQGIKVPESMSVSRENYPSILKQLRDAAGGGEVFTIGQLGFGAVQFGKLTLHLTAADGITHINSLDTTVFGGTVLGKGYLTMQEKLLYRGDLLVNNVSLKTLCSMFPNIQGYISGRVDGVISLSGKGSGVAGMTGFNHLWAREGGGEKMLVSKEFLQRLAKQKLSGFFFRSDRTYDRAEIKALLEEGDLTFDTLVIQHTNLVRVRDLSVSIAPGQNRISLDHLLESIKEAAVRGTPTTGGQQPAEAPAAPEFKWGE